MSNDHLFSADRRRVEGAASLGKALLSRIRGIGSGAMDKGVMAGHVSAAQHAAVGDFHRIASSPLAHGRTDRLTKAADILEQAAQVERLPSGPLKSSLVKRLEAAADGLSRPAVHNPQASRHGAAESPFESNELDSPDDFRESRGDPDSFRTSGRARGVAYESGYSYESDEPACPMERLFGPPQNASQMNWPDVDGGAARETRREGQGGSYDGTGPAKAAGYNPSMSLVDIAKAHMAGTGRAPLAKSLDVAFEHRRELGEALFQDYARMRKNLADARRPGDWRVTEDYRDLVARIERAPVSSLIKDQMLSALGG